jgi:hypothetical protein
MARPHTEPTAPTRVVNIRLNSVEQTRLEFVRKMIIKSTGRANISDAIRYCIAATYESES